MTVPKRNEQDQLARIAQAFRRGDVDGARRLVGALLRQNPRSVTGWGWACQLAPTVEERVRCLERILAIDPRNETARRQLKRLRVEEVRTARDSLVQSPPRRDAAQARRRLTRLRAFGAGTQEPVAPAMDGGTGDQQTASTPSRRGCRALLSWPLTWFGQLPTYLVLTLLLVPLLTGGLYYYQQQGGLWLGAGPGFETLAISESYERITTSGLYWQLEFERRSPSQFEGLVRHTSRIRERQLRILTHDILVTSGQFAEADQVSTSVVNHRFRWRSKTGERPAGAINLLHTVPADPAVYDQLLAIRAGDWVTITGRELLTIKARRPDGTLLGEWRDSGCNTLIVDHVEVAE
jgi:hypothetical protein